MTGYSDTDRTPRLIAGAAGADWFRLDVFQAPGAGFDPEFIPSIGHISASRIVSVSPHRGRSSPRESMGPGSCEVTIKGGYTYTNGAGVEVPLTVGLAIRAYITNMNAAFPAAGYPNRAEIAPRFVGTITDLGDVDISAGDPDNAVGSLTLTTARARIGNVTYEDDHAGDPIGTRYPRWLAAETDFLTINRALYVIGSVLDQGPFAGDVPYTPDAVTATYPNSMLFIDAPDSFIGKTINEVLAVYEAALGGVLIERRNGHWHWLTPAERRNAPAPVLIDPAWVLEPLISAQHIGELVNMQLVNIYAGGLPGAAVYEEDGISIAKLGRLPGDAIDTLLNVVAADFTDPALRQATELAGGAVARYSSPAWSTPAVTIDLTQMLIDGNAAGAYALANLDLGQLVELDSLPRRFPGDPGLYWVESMDESITASRWLLTLGLFPYALLSPGTRWIDIPADVTYADVPTDVTYVRSFTYSPEPYPAGSYRATYADLEYTDAAGLRWVDF